MANILIKNGVALTNIDITKTEIDTKTDIAPLNDKENLIKLITKADYENLTTGQKNNRTYLVVESPTRLNKNESVVPVMTEINQASTDKTLPTAKAVYNISKTLDGYKVKIVNSLPSIYDADKKTLYWLNGCQYCVNEQTNSWISVGVITDTSDFVLESTLPFYFGVDSNGNYGYRLKGEATVHKF